MKRYKDKEALRAIVQSSSEIKMGAILRAGRGSGAHDSRPKAVRNRSGQQAEAVRDQIAERD